MRPISEVTKGVAMGHLTKRVQVDAQGEMLDLKMTVSSMVNQLSMLANELARIALQVGTEVSWAHRQLSGCAGYLEGV